MVNTVFSPEVFSEQYPDLVAQEQQLQPNITIDNTLRVKILDKCGMTCTFCHNEGTPVMSDSGFQKKRVSIYANKNDIPFEQADISEQDSDIFTSALVDLKEAGLASELHWTGGEPTLSRSLVGLTRNAVDAGYSIKMTSNGQSGARQLSELKEAGLEGINFSIFGTTPEELAATQAPVFKDNLKLASLRMQKMGEAMIAACELGLKVKANIVISGEGDIERGLRLLEQVPADVKVRYQADTSNRVPSLLAIYSLMNQLEATPSSREIVAGCSIDNFEYELPSGREITFKQARFTRLPSACDDCPVDKAGECHEGYYGIRFYKDNLNDYWLSSCIQKMDTAQRLGEFLSPVGLGQVVSDYRKKDFDTLTELYSIDNS